MILTDDNVVNEQIWCDASPALIAWVEILDSSEFWLQI